MQPGQDDDVGLERSGQLEEALQKLHARVMNVVRDNEAIGSGRREATQRLVGLILHDEMHLVAFE